ncbi:hypothetical protein [uncultured Methylobacterium sp.]
MDTLYGGQGRDSLDGGTGANLHYGDGEDDTLLGGAGNDMEVGGSTYS